MSTKVSLDEEDFKDILNGMVDGVITINQRGIILTFNKTAETMFGYKSDEVINRNVSMLMPEPQRTAHDSYLHNYVSTGITKIIGIGRDVTALKSTGETFPMRLSVIEYPAKIENDRWFIGSCRDITLQKQQEEQLRRSLKMDAIGKLTSGIAHDYNNMLAVMMGYTDLLAREVKDNPKGLEYINAIKTANKRASNLTQKLLSFTRKRPDNTEMTLINEILINDEQLLAKTLTPQIKLSFSLAEGLWPVFIDKGSLEDTILNMSINAMHAMPEGGELDITTSNIQVGDLDAQILNIPLGDYVKLTITDTGIGMTDEIVSHIFEPFYTTKGEKGTGLGLSQVYNLIRQTNGAIKVYSEPGRGTCFSLYIPRCVNEQSTLPSPDSKSGNKNPLTGSASILIVDDERAVRMVSEKILSSHGYKVLVAASGKEALTLLDNETIDLVLSDVIMPEMDGFELAHLVQYTHPGVKIQLCSGMGTIKGKSVTNKEFSENLLVKPFSSEQLLTRVKELLSS